MGSVQHKEQDEVKRAHLSNLLFNQHRYIEAKRSLVSSTGDEVRLRAKTQQVFEQLASKPNEVISRDDLVSSVWGNVVVTDDALNQSIREIRKALDDSDRKILKTLPKQGYLLHATVRESPIDDTLPSEHSTIPRVLVLGSLAVVVFLLFSGVTLFKFLSTGSLGASGDVQQNRTTTTVNDTSEKVSDENLSVLIKLMDDPATEPAKRLSKKVVTALSQYSIIEPTIVDVGEPDYRLELSLLEDDGSEINFQLHHSASKQLVLAENLQISNSDVADAPNLAGRIAGLIGSPAGGAIGHHLLKSSRGKPADQLTRPECLAHGFGCTSCSGDIDSIVPTALQCLAMPCKSTGEKPKRSGRLGNAKYRVCAAVPLGLGFAGAHAN